MEYTNVKNAHIVPRVYVEKLGADGRIGVVQVRENKHLEMAVENVATRRHFYAADLPTARRSTTSSGQSVRSSRTRHRCSNRSNKAGRSQATTS